MKSQIKHQHNNAIHLMGTAIQLCKPQPFVCKGVCGLPYLFRIAAGRAALTHACFMPHASATEPMTYWLSGHAHVNAVWEVIPAAKATQCSKLLQELTSLNERFTACTHPLAFQQNPTLPLRHGKCRQSRFCSTSLRSGHNGNNTSTSGHAVAQHPCHSAQSVPSSRLHHSEPRIVTFTLRQSR